MGLQGFRGTRRPNVQGILPPRERRDYNRRMSETESALKGLWRLAARIAWLVLVAFVISIALAATAIWTKHNTLAVPPALLAILTIAAAFIGIFILSKRPDQRDRS
jgi:hypothetical protein